MVDLEADLLTEIFQPLLRHATVFRERLSIDLHLLA